MNDHRFELLPSVGRVAEKILAQGGPDFSWDQLRAAASKAEALIANFHGEALWGCRFFSAHPEDPPPSLATQNLVAGVELSLSSQGWELSPFWSTMAARDGQAWVACLGSPLAKAMVAASAFPSKAAKRGRDFLSEMARTKNFDLDAPLPGFGEIHEPTALGKACSLSQPALARLLLDLGADPNASDDAGRTPLSQCLLGDGANAPACVEELLASGADPAPLCAQPRLWELGSFWAATDDQHPIALAARRLESLALARELDVASLPGSPNPRRLGL